MKALSLLNLTRSRDQFNGIQVKWANNKRLILQLMQWYIIKMFKVHLMLTHHSYL